MTAPRNILVFDLGTSYFKACVFGSVGQLQAIARVSTPYTNTNGDYSEVSVSSFDEALLSLARELRKAAPEAYAAISAVTFSTQTNSFVLLDADDETLTPFVIWNDRRAMAHQAPLEEILALPDFYKKTGVPILSPEFMVAKLHWYQIQAPELWERVARIALISDYFTMRFTGQFVTEAGAAGLTGLIDIHELAWWPEALEIAGLEHDTLPEIVRAGSDLGGITPEAATRFGLPDECAFVVGCLDQYAGAIGAGNIAPGVISETTGTVLATVRCADEFTPEPGSSVFLGPASDPGRYYQMVFGDVSANLLEAFRGALPEEKSFAELDALAAEAETTLMLPTELDTPDLLALVRQWAVEKPVGEAARAILEGVAGTLKRQVTALCGSAPPLQIHCVGGAAKSTVWMGIKAHTLGVPMCAVACDEPTSLGAAVLARAALADAPLSDVVSQCVDLKNPISHVEENR
jgi:xylulokinase